MSHRQQVKCRRNDIKKRRLYRSIIVKSGLLVSITPYGLRLSDPGNWTELAMRTAVLNRTCRKLMSKEKAVQHIIRLLYSKRGVDASNEVVEMLIKAGSKPSFVRYWKWLWHGCFEDMSIHLFCMGLCKDNPDKAADKAGIDIYHVS